MRDAEFSRLIGKMEKVDQLMSEMTDRLPKEENYVVEPDSVEDWEGAYDCLGFIQSEDGFTYNDDEVDIFVERVDGIWYAHVDDLAGEECLSGQTCYDYVLERLQ